MSIAQVITLGAIWLIGALTMAAAAIVILSILGAARYRWFRVVMDVVTGRRQFSADEIKALWRSIPDDVRAPDGATLSEIREEKGGAWPLVWHDGAKNTGPHLVCVERDGAHNIIGWTYAPLWAWNKPVMRLHGATEVIALRVGDSRNYKFVVEGVTGLGDNTGRRQRWTLRVDRT